MSWRRVVKVVSMGVLPLALALSPARPYEDGGDGGGCYSGGPGSSSCGIGSDPGPQCSVSCNAGFYACCTIWGGCTCVQNPPPPPPPE
jgi:hypothetical protein